MTHHIKGEIVIAYKGFLFFIFYHLITKKMQQYHIKTEKEFLDTFGPSWRQVIKHGWSGDDGMDFLFGKPVTIPQLEDMVLKKSLYISNWHISEDMITPPYKKETPGVVITPNGLK